MWLFFLLQPSIFILLGLSTLCGGGKLSKKSSSKSSNKDKDVEAQQCDVSPSEQEVMELLEMHVEDEEGEEEVENEVSDDESSIESSTIVDDSSRHTESGEEGFENWGDLYRGDLNFDQIYVDTDDEITCVIEAASECNNFADCGVEAKVRHMEMMQNDFKPRYELGQIVSRRLGKTYFYHRGTYRHKKPQQQPMNDEERERMLARMKENYGSTTVKYSEKSKVNVVYGHDPVRGDCEFDELTMDDMDFKSRQQLELNIDKVLAGKAYDCDK